MTPTLTPDEIVDITGYKLPKLQLKWLVDAGYPARLRPDNTVSLGRAQYERGPQSGEPGTMERPTVQKIPRGKTAKEPATAS